MKLSISREAKRDLFAISRYGALRFGVAQAKAYAQHITQALRAIAHSPKIAADRSGYGRPIRIHPVGSHVIVCELRETSDIVVRVLHGHRNWTDHI